MKNMEIYKTLESLGFFEWLYDTHDLRDTDMKPEYLDRLSLDDIHRTVANSMAFRWFRDRHGLYHYITTHDSTDFEWYVYDKDQNDWEDNTTQNTPEEAELASLSKLIEIVKNKENVKQTIT
jgi:hypothetical protein